MIDRVTGEEGEPIRYQGKTIGVLTVSGKFVKEVVRSRDFLRVRSAWCVNEHVLASTQASMVIIAEEDGRRWRASRYTIINQGYAWDKGYGPQRALHEKFWEPWELYSDAWNTMAERAAAEVVRTGRRLGDLVREAREQG